MKSAMPCLKCAFDIIVPSVALTLLSLFMALIALAIRLTLGLPIFFRQERLGYRGRPFIILKFCALTDVRVGSWLLWVVWAFACWSV